mmetsp:Transcript_45000/g.75686  ORF Transcript_45000/g.75686 Transcript_45000/m.75686 type:complete len:239 (+) Transcript_45000:1547-2263(+)
MRDTRSCCSCTGLWKSSSTCRSTCCRAARTPSLHAPLQRPVWGCYGRCCWIMNSTRKTRAIETAWPRMRSYDRSTGKTVRMFSSFRWTRCVTGPRTGPTRGRTWGISSQSPCCPTARPRGCWRPGNRAPRSSGLCNSSSVLSPTPLRATSSTKCDSGTRTLSPFTITRSPISTSSRCCTRWPHRTRSAKWSTTCCRTSATSTTPRCSCRTACAPAPATSTACTSCRRRAASCRPFRRG